MIGTAAVIALLSTLVFAGLVFVQDRPRGALIAQIGSVAAAALIFVALVFDALLYGIGLSALQVSALGLALLAATVGGMFYHLYLGRFDDVWRARFVFALVYLGVAAVLGTLYLALL